jgi:hypothetical protein
MMTRSRTGAIDKRNYSVLFAGVARALEGTKRENDDNTMQEVEDALQRTCVDQSQTTAVNARRDVRTMELEDTLRLASNLTEENANELVNAFQVFEVTGTRREKPHRRSPEWDEPIAKELRSLEEHDVFEIVDRPKGKKLERIEVIRVVQDDGSLRARICFNGKQQDVLTYSQTASPVAPAPLIRMFFALCAARGRPPRGGDFKSAYLHVEEENDIYAEVFEEYKKFIGKDVDFKGKALRLKKKLYGAKASGLGWYDHLKDLLVRGGFYPDPVEPTLFRTKELEDDGKPACLITVVDDFTVSASEERYDQLIQFFEESGYKITGKGITRRFAGINVGWDEKEPHVITLDQSDKIKFLVEDHKDEHGARKRNMPIDTKFNAILDQEYEPQQGETKKYMSVLGSLMHIATVSTLPTAFATSANARVMSRPKPIHYDQLMHTVGYLKTDRPEFTLRYDFTECPGDLTLYAFSDASFADDKKGARSTMGFVVGAGGCAVHWKSGLTSTVATSTAESERNAAFACSKSIVYLSHVLESVGFPQRAVRLFCDNQATIKSMLNVNVATDRRHERVQRAWLHHVCINQRYIQPFFVRSESNIADVMTKPLAGTTQSHHERLLRMATGHHGDVPWLTWMRGLTEANAAFQKNDNLIEVKDYHKEVQNFCVKKGARTANLA